MESPPSTSLLCPWWRAWLSDLGCQVGVIHTTASSAVAAATFPHWALAELQGLHCLHRSATENRVPWSMDTVKLGAEVLSTQQSAFPCSKATKADRSPCS